MRGIFIGNGQADKIGIAGFTVPEAGIQVAILYNQRAIRLSTQRIVVDPQGFQCTGVECLYTAIGQSHKYHALRIGGRGNGEAGFMIHRSGCQNTACHGVYPENPVAGIGNQITSHQDWAADRIGVNAAAQLICPVQCAVIRRGGNPEIRHRIICIGSTEIRPGRPDSRIYGAVYRSLRQFPENRNRTAGSGFCHWVADLSILNH